MFAIANMNILRVGVRKDCSRPPCMPPFEENARIRRPVTDLGLVRGILQGGAAKKEKARSLRVAATGSVRSGSASRWLCSKASRPEMSRCSRVSTQERAGSRSGGAKKLCL